MARARKETIKGMVPSIVATQSFGAGFWASQPGQDRAILGFQDERGWGLTYCIPLRDRHCQPRLMCSGWPDRGPHLLRPWH